MRHTDGLLGIKPKHVIDRELEQEVEQRRLTLLAKEKLQALQSLKLHPGWAIFKQHCKADRLRILGLIEVASDPTSLAKLTGVLLAVTSFEQWAESEAESLAVQLEQNAI